jgi:PleD family two-component response regulator
MILAVVDDLMFSSRIRTVAKQVGVEIAFARTPEDALRQARSLTPTLVIFDLNSLRTQPIATIAALKRDPAIAGIPTIGFVSHVQTEVIAAARAAGADQVLARSAFAANLPQILLESGAA